MVVQTRSSASRGGGRSLSTTVDTERRGAFATNKGGRKSNHCKFSSSSNRTPQSPPIQHHQQEEEEEEEEEPIQKLLEALGKDSLAVVVKEAVSKYGDPDYVERIQKVADEDPALRKIRVEVVGRAYFDAKTLTSVFESYGEIEQFNFVPNPTAGFATVVSATADILFKHRYGARTVLRMPRIEIVEGVWAITMLHSLLGQFWNPLMFTPGFCFRALTGHPPLVVKEPGEKLVDFFGKSYLVGLVMEAISKHPDFVQSVQTQASLDLTCRRLQVSCKNLPHSLTTLTSFYGKYGEIEECTATRTTATILYKHRKSVYKALKQPRSKIAIGLRGWCRPGKEVVGLKLWKSTGVGVGWSPISRQPGWVGGWVGSCLGLDKLKDQTSGVTEISTEDRLIPVSGHHSTSGRAVGESSRSACRS